ncbi:lipopolysaccharide transport system permease protein [Singulisphaera sp. GP187]|uniref:ABC transporter permease n=1 Tax=Singulisphaera sp. GP187 TaxID=1882752 RepID=UPI000928FE99|nr:ABC transporter permease [Singulisphaera sp. GP187]SIO09746.1 lipopolysaccharide transport system permease protein [Singulisphaera sp. GP187]
MEANHLVGSPSRISGLSSGGPSEDPWAAALRDRDVTLITPPGRWRLVNFTELIEHSELLYFLIWRDVKVRYKQTFLGAAWAVLQPALLMVVCVTVFGRARGGPTDVPYPLFVFTGLLAWTFFATAVAAAGNSVVSSERLISKVYFPRLAVPFAAVGAAIVDSIIASVLLIALLVYYGIVPGLIALLAPAFFAILILAALGVGTLLAALNVAYRDFRYAIPFLIQLWMFATPTVYLQVQEVATERPAMTSAHHDQHEALITGRKKAPLGESRGLLRQVSFRVFKALNPLAGPIAAFRASILGGPVPWLNLATSSLGILLIFLGGCLYFRKVEDSFADVI